MNNKLEGNLSYTESLTENVPQHTIPLDTSADKFSYKILNALQIPPYKAGMCMHHTKNYWSSLLMLHSHDNILTIITEMVIHMAAIYHTA